ncbi:hypothetical protein Tco_1245331 [Tanacetum coccineum]
MITDSSAEACYQRLGSSTMTPLSFDHHRRPCTISGAIHRTTTISPVKTDSRTVKNHTYFSGMTNGRGYSPPPGFSTLTHLPSLNVEYSSDEYDEDIKMEPRSARANGVTPILRVRSLRVRRPRGRVVEFLKAPNRDGSSLEGVFDGRRPSERRVEDGASYGENLPYLLASHLGRSEN